MAPALLRAALAVAIVAACSGGPARWQGMGLQPLTVGWEQFFRVQWSSDASRGQPIIGGYIENVWGFWARNIQVLVSGYDSAGTRIGQFVGWGPYSIPPGGRVYFELPAPPAATYEVAIFAWTWVLDDDWREFELR